MKTGYRIWCEWDMGMDWENIIFTSKEKMNASLKEADWTLADTTLEEALEDELVGFDVVEIK